MFVFFEFFAPFFKKLWINRLNHRLPVPVRIPKKVLKGVLPCSACCGAWEPRKTRPDPPLYLRLYAAANYRSKKSGVNIYP